MNRKPLKVKLNTQEYQAYPLMLSQVNAQNPEHVTGPEAVAFFKRSGLPMDRLKEIWLLAARTSTDYLSRDDFYVALRLIAYCQNNMKCDEEFILYDM